MSGPMSSSAGALADAAAAAPDSSAGSGFSLAPTVRQGEQHQPASSSASPASVFAAGSHPTPGPLALPQTSAATLCPNPADALLEDLLLAKERAIFYRTVVTETTTTACEGWPTHHGGAAAAALLRLSAVPQAPPPPRQDAADTSSAARAKADARASTADGDGGRWKRKTKGKRHSSTAQRASSRREQAHAARMAVALNPAFILPALEGAAAARQAGAGSSSSSSSVGDEGNAASLPALALAQPPSHADAAEKVKGRSTRTHHRSGRSREPQAVGVAPATARAVRVADESMAGTTAAVYEGAPQGYDDLPDGEDAEQIIARRMRLLQSEHSGDAAAAASSVCGTAALVRPPHRFHRGPVPAWMREYSDLLLFDRHHLDREVAIALRRAWAGLTGRCCRASGRAEGLVQLPVDAVVLRLRSDIARVRRLRDALHRHRRSGGIHSLIHPDLYPARYEVYRPAEPSWCTAHQPPTAGETAAEMDVGGGNDGGDEGAPPATPRRTPAARPSPPPLSRVMEAMDLRRPLLAQTIPLWRRDGAAVTLLTELLDLLEDRLSAFGAPLDNPEQGALLDLAGAPESAGVDGTVHNTYPPALERAIRTTITNTMLSDVFATPSSAIANRGLRLSEARRRRQTPHIHADYITVMDRRPLYDSTVLQTLRRASSAASSTSASRPHRDAQHRRPWSRGGGAAAVGVDSRKPYAVHIDYVRFQPSLDNISGMAALGAGFGAEGTSSVAAAMRTAGDAGDGRGRCLCVPSSSEGVLSSLLLGSYSELFLPRDVNASGDAVAADSHAAQLLPPPCGHGHLHTAASALLLALSMATAQHSLVAFSPEEYLTALLLQYYEQYRLLQLNLLPVLKHRSFYEEQVRHLQRQSHRSSNIDQLQQRLELLAKTSADVERGCLRAMLVLWNSVLTLRRQTREPSQQCAAEELNEAMVDAPIIVEDTRRRPRQKEPTAAAMAQEGRPAVFGAEASTALAESSSEKGVPVDDARVAITPVVHRVDSSVLHEDRVGRDITGIGSQSQQQGKSRVSSLSSFLSISGSPLAQPSTTARAAPAASARPSPLLAPASCISSGGAGRSDGGTDKGGEGAAAAAVGKAAQPRCFRLFLRRYGTAEETPYVAGDDLLHYAAEVEGTDVLQGGRGPGADRLAAAAVTAAQDELVYFQVVVFTRSHAAMAPQYVGCTAPRPMTAAKVVFFNETFEVRTLHEPAELLLHLIPVTAGPSKHTVVSTVRLRPTLTRTYSLRPLQSPTAFAFRGKLFACHRRAATGANGAAPSTTATSVHGVLAVSTTWTSSQGMSVSQIERLFLGDGGGAGTAPDPLDPQYLPLLRTLRAYYEEQDMFRAGAASDGGEAPSLSRHWHSADMAPRRSAAAGGLAPPRAAHNDAGSRLSHRHARPRTRHSNPASTRRRRQPSALSVSDGPTRIQAGRGAKASPAALSETREHLQRMASSGQLRQGAGGAAAAGAAGGGHGGRDYYATNAALQRFSSARLWHLHRRWLIHTNKMRAADEAEARLLAHPMPLDDADVYALQKTLKRSVEREDADRLKGYGAAAGTLFSVEHYYSAPSATSGLPLSPLPPETKLRLWQERQRRRLLTRKARCHLTDAEKLEAVVRVPKLSLRLVLYLAPRSQLNPHRKVRPKTADIDRALLARRRDSRIVIHVMKAHNLPLRADGTLLEPFVQASFVSEVAYTRSEVGSNPSWFQSLELPFQPLNFEEDTLGMIDDDVVISLYDMVEVKMGSAAATTVAAVAHETHHRTERRFIGTLHIPFSSLHQASQARMEGVYPLRIPRWILGYDTPLSCSDSAEGEAGRRGATSGAAAASQNPFGTIERPSGSGAAAAAGTGGGGGAAVVVLPPQLTPTRDDTNSDRQIIEPTLQLYMSLWPPLQREPPPGLSRAEMTRKVGELNVSPQLRYLHQVALKWQQTALQKVKTIGAMNAQASARQIDPFVTCSTGDLMLRCRFMLPRGGPPPPSVRAVYEAIRYVSLLPCVTDALPWRARSTWCTNAELLATRPGDCEELALLLAHLLRHLAPHRPTYAVLGRSAICPHAVMVLHAFGDAEWMLIDPGAGSTVPVAKPHGTVLRDVYAVISHDQMWANVQLSGFPHRMAWDLASPAQWLPCFDSARDARIAACTPHMSPVQREVLTFPAADPIKSREIEMELRSCLKRALLTWRNGLPPAYHRGVETILRELLELAEAERCTCGSARRNDITLSAAARLSAYFGESVMGEPAGSARAVHHHRHRRRTSDGARLEVGADGHAREEKSAAAQPATTTVSARASPLRLLGSPVMGSYNPSDPQFHELLQRVFECAVHEVGTSEASFAVATYVKSYTGDVCAMWVFLVAICRG
ncbi:hypothetical protein LSCM1_08211 [Leishmania martiniquensis]|uniref:C2 domain-containing protein n=1 Tax=Leishmania martiniquensis TaxID=1580590 RepID=A0A836GU14_9TRYP|nr:hypothetical protein LSCM1_08211 [Leishmania martiniquensis]